MEDYKEKVVATCLQKLKAQVDFIQNQLLELKEANSQETKSTAGDKHETGRAMVHLEQEKLFAQLGQFQKQLSFYNSINFEPQKSISIGSLVKTNQAHYFVAVGIGLFEVFNEKIFGISAASPIGKILLGKEIGNKISFNGNEIEILKIL